jgi:hypothetical protein
MIFGLVAFFHEIKYRPDPDMSSRRLPPPRDSAIGFTENPRSYQTEKMMTSNTTPYMNSVATTALDSYLNIATCILDEKSSAAANPVLNALLAAETRKGDIDCKKLDEVTRRKRLEYIEKAASEGTAGAAIYLAAEGPFGDYSSLQTRPDDPLVVEWKLKAMSYLTKAADNGDLTALLALSRLDVDILNISQSRENASTYALALSNIGNILGFSLSSDPSQILKSTSEISIQERLLIGKRAAEIIKRRTGKIVFCDVAFECR